MIRTCIASSNVAKLICSCVSAGKDPHGLALEKAVLHLYFFFLFLCEVKIWELLLVLPDRLLQYICRSWSADPCGFFSYM